MKEFKYLCMYHPNARNNLKVSKEYLYKDNFKIDSNTAKFAMPLALYYGIDEITTLIMQNTPTDAESALINLKSWDPDFEPFDEYLAAMGLDEYDAMENAVYNEIRYQIEDLIAKVKSFDEDTLFERLTNNNCAIQKDLENGVDVVDVYTPPKGNSIEYRVNKFGDNNINHRHVLFVNTDDKTLLSSFNVDIISLMQDRPLHITALPYLFPERFDGLSDNRTKLRIMTYGSKINQEDLNELATRGWYMVTYAYSDHVTYIDPRGDSFQKIKL